MDSLTIFYWTVGLMVFSGALGFYMGERGITGIKNDLNNIKIDMERLRNFVHPLPATTPVPQTVAVVTPITGSKVTDTRTVTTPASI